MRGSQPKTFTVTFTLNTCDRLQAVPTNLLQAVALTVSSWASGVCNFNSQLWFSLWLLVRPTVGWSGWFPLTILWYNNKQVLHVVYVGEIHRKCVIVELNIFVQLSHKCSILKTQHTESTLTRSRLSFEYKSKSTPICLTGFHNL